MTTTRTRTTQPTVKIGRYYELKEEVPVPGDYVLTEKIKIKPPTKKQMTEFRNATANDVAERAILGDSADAVEKLYENQPDREYQAFFADLWKHFFGPGAEDPKSGDASS